MPQFYQYEPAAMDLRIYAGSDYPIVVDYTDDTDAPIDITGWTFVSKIKDYDGNTVATLSFSIVGAASGGHTVATLTSTQTLGMVDKDLGWDLFAVLPGDVASGGGKRPIFKGNVVIDKSVSV